LAAARKLFENKATTRAELFACDTCRDTGSVQLANAPVYDGMPMDEYIHRCLMPCPLRCSAGVKFADDYEALYGEAVAA
jgi:hypothetical protein